MRKPSKHAGSVALPMPIAVLLCFFLLSCVHYHSVSARDLHENVWHLAAQSDTSIAREPALLA